MCEFDPRCEGSDGLVDNALAQISAGRWAVTGVYGDELNPAFAYTTGLTEFSRPELVIYGLDPAQACGILNRAAQRLIDDPYLFDAPRLTGIVRPPYALTSLPTMDTTEFTVTRLLYGPDFRAVQLIWPDSAGRFPWEYGYAYSRDAQPLMGIPHPDAA
ncbi:hypothetical protein GOHSU_16_00820 [Gordonia hirsuta DSM 44140 = NBRC 16056]|uniref:DUF4262 domain-containing protein n=1 Tax=Gordonia hirsuta DSM 44140 = NBRC 16056 TaxID=1121927 RepID=L7L885_9ACTN|nr:DUF4262 domain-containing protein [Gordonia hirsuta]GAC57124.1 hypothetical protein GOHSU_16_00820 [Gordonia hirsuta DSM 44140 = NBRC 16056]